MASRQLKDSADEWHEIASRIADSLDDLRSTGLKRALIVHAIYMEANRGLPANTKVGKRQVERVLDALDDLPGLLFDPEDSARGAD